MRVRIGFFRILLTGIEGEGWVSIYYEYSLGFCFISCWQLDMGGVCLNSCVILIRISSRDTGKTMVDASLGEIMTTCEKITWLLSEGEKWLKPEYRYFIHHFVSVLLCYAH